MIQNVCMVSYGSFLKTIGCRSGQEHDSCPKTLVLIHNPVVPSHVIKYHKRWVHKGWCAEIKSMVKELTYENDSKKCFVRFVLFVFLIPIRGTGLTIKTIHCTSTSKLL